MPLNKEIKANQLMFHYFFSSLARSRYSSCFSLSFTFILWSTKMQMFTISFLLVRLKLGWLILPGLNHPFSFENSREHCLSHFQGQTLVCAYTICLYGQILLVCTIPSLSTSPPSHACSCTQSVSVSWIYLLSGWLFLHIVCTCYFPESYLF